MNKILLVLLVALLMAGCGDDAVEKLEQRVDELEDELEQVKRDQSYSQGRQRSLFGLFGGEEEEAAEAMPSNSNSEERNSGWTSGGTDNVDDPGNIAE